MVGLTLILCLRAISAAVSATTGLFPPRIDPGPEKLPPSPWPLFLLTPIARRTQRRAFSKKFSSCWAAWTNTGRVYTHTSTHKNDTVRDHCCMSQRLFNLLVGLEGKKRGICQPCIMCQCPSSPKHSISPERLSAERTRNIYERIFLSRPYRSWNFTIRLVSC